VFAPLSDTDAPDLINQRARIAGTTARRERRPAGIDRQHRANPEPVLHSAGLAGLP